MPSVYILYSKKINRFYIGSCHDLDMRLKQHREKFFPKAYTAKSDDWELFLHWNTLTIQQAKKAEALIKKKKSAVFIRSLKNENGDRLFSRLKLE